MNNTTNLPSGIQHFYDRAFLLRAIPLFLFALFAQFRPLPAGNSTIIKFRRYNSLAAALTPLTEGTTPAGSNATVTDITATIAQYGDFIEFSDLVSLTNPDPLLLEFSELLGEQAADTLDQIVRDVLAAGTSVHYSNGASRAAVNTLVAASQFKNAVRELKNNNARKVTRRMAASTGIGTEPVESAYIGFIHPDISHTVRDLSGFTKAKDYPDQMGRLPGEIGTLEEVRLLETTNTKIFAGGGATGGTGVKETSSNADVYQTVIVAANAYGLTNLAKQDNNNNLIAVKELGSSGTADPLNQRGTIGWKLNFVAKILNDAFMTRIESAAAA